MCSLKTGWALHPTPLAALALSPDFPYPLQSLCSLHGHLHHLFLVASSQREQSPLTATQGWYSGVP